MLTAEDIENRVKESLNVHSIRASDMTGGGDHWQLMVVSGDFADKTLVEQHQLVYKALGAWMHKEIHALALNTKTPE
jgi:stress-induced morphogen